MKLSAVLEETGISKRQFDYWCTNGWVPGVEASPGQGNHREVNTEQRTLIKTMAELVIVGFTPKRASSIAISLMYSDAAVFKIDGATYRVTREVEEEGQE